MLYKFPITNIVIYIWHPPINQIIVMSGVNVNLVISRHLTLSCDPFVILPIFIVRHLTLSSVILSHLKPSYFILPYLMSYFFITRHLTSSSVILRHLTPSCVMLPHLVSSLTSSYVIWRHLTSSYVSCCDVDVYRTCSGEIFIWKIDMKHWTNILCLASGRIKGSVTNYRRTLPLTFSAVFFCICLTLMC